MCRCSQVHFSMSHNRNGEMSFHVAQAPDMESCGKGLCLMWGHLPKSSHEPGPCCGLVLFKRVRN